MLCADVLVHMNIHKHIHTFGTVCPYFLPLLFIVMIKPEKNNSFRQAVHITTQWIRIHHWHAGILIWSWQVLELPWSDLGKMQGLQIDMISFIYSKTCTIIKQILGRKKQILDKPNLAVNIHT